MAKIAFSRTDESGASDLSPTSNERMRRWRSIGNNEDDGEEAKGRSETMGSTSSRLLSSVLQRMHPRNCFHASTSNGAAINESIPPLIHQLNESHTNEKAKISALDRIYQLSDLSHKQNRVPLVCTSKWNILGVLIKSLGVQDAGICEERRLACLALNNLSIPFENKAVMALGADSDHLLQALVSVIQQGYPEAYLCCICLMNLTFLDDAIQPVLYFVPQSQSLNPLDRSDSLLRSVEAMLKMYSPFILSKLLSVEGEAIRWATGFVRNVSNNEIHAELLSKTEIPALVVGYVRDSPHSIERWTRDSLEELSLLVLCNLARFEKSKAVLQRAGVGTALERVKGQGGIHEFRTKMILASLDET